jgi:hypothetical protein
MKDSKDTILWRLVNLNPAVYRGLVVAVFSVLAAVGIKVSPEIPDVSLVVLLAVLPLLQAGWTKGAVTPNAKVAVVVPDPINEPNKVRAGQAEVNAPDAEVIKAAQLKGPFL